MITSKKAIAMMALFCIGLVQAQDEIMSELDSAATAKKENVSAAFKGIQICNMQSTKLAAKGEWYFLVSHRFGDLTNGLDNFFGLDNALTKIGGLYGPTDWLTVGASRHTYNKIYELSAKYRLASQKVDGFPLTVVGYNTAEINTKLSTDEYPDLQFAQRMAYSSQLLVSHKFNEKLTLQLSPVYIHKNLYEPTAENKDQFVLGGGGRFKITKRMSFNIEYAARVNTVQEDVYQNPLTAGIDIDTGGHVFQLVFSNCQAMNDVAYYTNATGKWGDKGIFFGFNMYRVF